MDLSGNCECFSFFFWLGVRLNAGKECQRNNHTQQKKNANVIYKFTCAKIHGLDMRAIYAAAAELMENCAQIFR